MTNGAVKRAMVRLGIPRDCVLMVHSAFRTFAREGYSLEGALDDLINHMAPGTLLLPAMSWRVVRPSNPFFDEIATPSNVGAMAELFRTRHATHRSLHPTHSAAALGKAAVELTRDHHCGDTPCSDLSPFGKLAAFDAWVLMLGITMDCCTMLHHAEEKVAPALYLRPPAEAETYTCRRRTGEEVTVRLRRHLFLPRDYYQFQDMLACEGRFHIAALGSLVLRAFRARDLMNCAMRVLVARPDTIIAGAGQRYRLM